MTSFENLPDAIKNLIIHFLIITSAKDLLETRLLTKKYQFIHRDALVSYRKVYFYKKLQSVKLFLHEIKQEERRKKEECTTQKTDLL